MTRRKHGFKILGLAVLVAAGLMAFSAAAAQGEFLILGAGLEQFGVEEAAFEGSVDTPFSFLVEPKNYEINCPEVDITGTLLLSDADAKFTFRKCAIFSMEPLEEIKGCHVSLPAGGQLIFFLNALILTVLHKTKEENGEEQTLTFLLAEQLPGSGTLGIVHLKTEAGCPLPEALNIKGTIAMTINQGGAITNLIRAGGETLQLLLGDALRINEKEAFLDGSFFAELTGLFKGCKWGAI